MKPFISFCLLLCICLGKLYAQGVNIVYIGNSITQGALLKTPVTEAPPVQASQYIEQATKQSVAFRNCGVSGTTTLDFLPIAERQFPNVKSAAQELSQRCFFPLCWARMTVLVTVHSVLRWNRCPTIPT